MADQTRIQEQTARALHGATMTELWLRLEQAEQQRDTLKAALERILWMESGSFGLVAEAARAALATCAPETGADR